MCHRQLLCEEKEKEQGERDDSFTRHQAVAGPVRLELGMDAEVLDEILDEIEVMFTHSFFPFLLGSPSIFDSLLFVTLCAVVHLGRNR